MKSPFFFVPTDFIGSPSGIAEVVDCTYHSVALTRRLHRIDCVVVRGFGTQSVDSHPENSVGMVLIQPDVRLRSLGQMGWIRAVMHNSKMLVGPARIIAGPTDNCDVTSH